MSSVSKLVCVLGMLLFGAFAIMQVSATMDVMRVTSDDVKDAAPALVAAQPAPDPVRAAPPRQISFFRNNGRQLGQGEAKMLLEQNGFVTGRSARLSRYFDLRDFVKEGELLPQHDLQDLFARVRATPMAQAECAWLLAAFASECRVDSYRVKRIAGSTRYELQSILLFIQKTPAGPMPGTQRVLVREEHIRGARVEYPEGDDAAFDALRVKLLGEVEAACAALRRRFGTCYLKNVTLSSARFRGRPSVSRSVLMQVSLPLEGAGH